MQVEVMAELAAAAAIEIDRIHEVIGERDERLEGGRGARRGDVFAIVEDRAVGRHEAGLEPFGRAAEGNQAVGNLFGERAGLGPWPAM